MLMTDFRAGILADFHFAGVDGDGAVFGDVQPGGELRGPGVASKTLGTARFLRQGVAVKNEQKQNAPAQHFEEITPLEIEAITRPGEKFVTFELKHVGLR